MAVSLGKAFRQLVQIQQNLEVQRLAFASAAFRGSAAGRPNILSILVDASGNTSATPHDSTRLARRVCLCCPRCTFQPQRRCHDLLTRPCRGCDRQRWWACNRAGPAPNSGDCSRSTLLTACMTLHRLFLKHDALRHCEAEPMIRVGTECIVIVLLVYHSICVPTLGVGNTTALMGTWTRRSSS